MATLPLSYATTAHIVPDLITDYPKPKDDSPKAPKWPYSSADMCKHYRAMDEYYGTPENSPLHHDNRCTLMFKGD
jgi:hypothetical protein